MTCVVTHAELVLKSNYWARFKHDCTPVRAVSVSELEVAVQFITSFSFPIDCADSRTGTVWSGLRSLFGRHRTVPVLLSVVSNMSPAVIYGFIKYTLSSQF